MFFQLVTSGHLFKVYYSFISIFFTYFPVFSGSNISKNWFEFLLLALNHSNIIKNIAQCR